MTATSSAMKHIQFPHFCYSFSCSCSKFVSQKGCCVYLPRTALSFVCSWLPLCCTYWFEWTSVAPGKHQWHALLVVVLDRFHQGLFACLSFAAVRGDSHHIYLLCIAYVTWLTFPCLYELISNICGYNVCYSIIEWLAETPWFLVSKKFFGGTLRQAPYAEPARSRIYLFWYVVYCNIACDLRDNMYTPTDPMLCTCELDWGMLSNTLWPQHIQKLYRMI